jgi:hypothetical protein
MGKEIVKKTVKETVLYTDIVTVCGEDPQYLFLVIEIQKNAIGITNFVSVIWVSQGRSITSFRLRVTPKLAIWVRDKVGFCTAGTCQKWVSFGNFYAANLPKVVKIVQISFFLAGNDRTCRQKLKTVVKSRFWTSLRVLFTCFLKFKLGVHHSSCRRRTS